MRQKKTGPVSYFSVYLLWRYCRNNRWQFNGQN